MWQPSTARKTTTGLPHALFSTTILVRLAQGMGSPLATNAFIISGPLLSNGTMSLEATSGICSLTEGLTRRFITTQAVFVLGYMSSTEPSTGSLRASMILLASRTPRPSLHAWYPTLAMSPTPTLIFVCDRFSYSRTPCCRSCLYPIHGGLSADRLHRL